MTDLVKPNKKNTICILFVDDQSFIVDTGKRILENLGACRKTKLEEVKIIHRIDRHNDACFFLK